VLLGTDGGGPGAVLAEPTAWTRLVDHSGTPRQQATRLLSLLFPPEVSSEADRLFGDVVAEARANLSMEALSAQERAMNAWHAAEPAWPGLPHPPVLVATGTVDVVIPPANAELLAERWGAARVERIEGGGHAFMAQDPEHLGTLIASFLDTVG
jgi:pimeloyl-ACP methyl ester carboxylesterase